MYIKNILKIFMTFVVLLSLVFSISFMAACGGTATAEEATVEKAEELEEDIGEAIEEDEEVEEVAEDEGETAEEEEEAAAENIKIESGAFGNNEMIPVNYTCDGANINPQLAISGVPSDTVSLALILDDPDAPGGVWVHWTVWNIDPSVTEIQEDSVPTGAVEGTTDFGVAGYRGPCPPSGTHHYSFKLYALDTTLGLDSSATAQDVSAAMNGHILESTELVVLYGQ
jgi:Raf kinase inhibitor-like YbhB/YbcL family protein